MTDETHSPLGRAMGRREALMLLGGLGAGGLWIAGNPLGTARAAVLGHASATCVLTPEVTEGPYWVQNSLTRRNVTEGQAGTPLLLSMIVQNVKTCRAIPAADVEIWHANATGVYSDVQGNTKTFLRGHQKGNAAGKVLFQTIVPGWYPGRAPHIHIKVHVGGKVVHTGQLFFQTALLHSVYQHGAYKSHGQANVPNASDQIFEQAGGNSAIVKLHKRSGKSGYAGTMTLAVAA